MSTLPSTAAAPLAPAATLPPYTFSQREIARLMILRARPDVSFMREAHIAYPFTQPEAPDHA